MIDTIFPRLINNDAPEGFAAAYTVIFTDTGEKLSLLYLDRDIDSKEAIVSSLVRNFASGLLGLSRFFPGQDLLKYLFSNIASRCFLIFSILHEITTDKAQIRIHGREDSHNFRTATDFLVQAFQDIG